MAETRARTGTRGAIRQLADTPEGEAAPADDAGSADEAVEPEPPAAEPDAPAARSAEDRWSALDSRLDELIRQGELRNQQRKDVWYFLSSGVFFMIVGSCALAAAFLTMSTTHTSFTFVLVVIGVAILLYGTGTQGAGNFESAAGAMKYKVGIAGGAGILAFAVALGIVSESDDIRGAFQIERKYAKLYFRDKGDGVANLADYVPEISIDGLPVPAQRSGEYIVAYVPFVARQRDKQLQITANFYYVGSEQNRNRLLARVVSLRQNVEFQPGRISSEDAGFDFPRLNDDDVVVNLINDEVGNDPDASQIAAIDGSDQPVTNAPPPVVTGFQ